MFFLFLLMTAGLIADKAFASQPMPLSIDSSSLSLGSEFSSQVFRGDDKEPRTSADEIPALAGTLVQLELLLKPQTIDLEAITRLICSDVGLSIQVLRHSQSEVVGCEAPWRISDCVIHLGPKLLGLARPLCSWAEYRDHSYAEAEAFWLHAKLVAAVAERTAAYFYELNVNPEQAYISGLMHNLERLPRILDLVGLPSFDRNVSNLQEWVMEWNLPSFIMDTLATVHSDFDPTKSGALARVVNFARCWIDLCLPWAETCLARKTRFKLPVLQAANLICRYFPGTEVDPLVPFIEILKDATLDKLDEVRPESSPAIQHRGAVSDRGAFQKFRQSKNSATSRQVFCLPV
jgi:hypothetical protein